MNGTDTSPASQEESIRWTALIEKPSRRNRSGSTMVATGRGRAAICCAGSGESFEEDAANARLIAAAPELLNALKAAWTMCPPGHLNDERGHWALIRKAITAATGGAA